MLNRVILQARLGATPELKRTTSGVEVVSVNVAIDRDFKDKNTGVKETDWVTVVAFRETAKFLADYFTKGRMIIVEGRLQVREWTDQNNNKRRSTEVVADRVYFGDSKREATSNTYIDNEPVAAPGYSMIEDDGELPF